MYTEEIGALIHHLVEGGTLRGLPPGSIDVYCVLLARAREGTGRARGSPRTIARLTGLSELAVLDLLIILRDHRLIAGQEVKTPKGSRTDFLVLDTEGVFSDLR